MVLALAYLGAAGSTAEQIALSLHLPADRDDVKTGFAALLGSLKVKKDKNGAARYTCFSVSTAFLNIFMLNRLVEHRHFSFICRSCSVRISAGTPSIGTVGFVVFLSPFRQMLA
jgi:hypothetical protein